jgi:hypothetical protein
MRVWPRIGRPSQVVWLNEMAPGQKEIIRHIEDGYALAWDSTEDSEARRAVAEVLRKAADLQVELLRDELFPRK